MPADQKSKTRETAFVRSQINLFKTELVVNSTSTVGKQAGTV